MSGGRGSRRLLFSSASCQSWRWQRTQGERKNQRCCIREAHATSWGMSLLPLSNPFVGKLIGAGEGPVERPWVGSISSARRRSLLPFCLDLFRLPGLPREDAKHPEAVLLSILFVCFSVCCRSRAQLAARSRDPRHLSAPHLISSSNPTETRRTRQRRHRVPFSLSSTWFPRISQFPESRTPTFHHPKGDRHQHCGGGDYIV